MARPPIVPILRLLGDDAVSLFLREVRNFLVALRDNSLLWSNQVSVTFAGASTQNVSHGLGRIPTGYVIEGKSADVRVWDGGTPTAEFLPLTSSAAGTVRLRVY
jgi:hypothetical protein